MDNNYNGQNQSGYTPEQGNYYAPPTYNPNPYQQGYNYNYNYNYAPQEAEVQALADSALTCSIIAIVLADLPLIGIISIILGFSASGKGKRAVSLARLYGCRCSPKATVGKILGLVGGIIGIISTAFYGFYFLLLLALNL